MDYFFGTKKFIDNVFGKRYDVPRSNSYFFKLDDNINYLSRQINVMVDNMGIKEITIDIDAEIEKWTKENDVDGWEPIIPSSTTEIISGLNRQFLKHMQLTLAKKYNERNENNPFRQKFYVANTGEHKEHKFLTAEDFNNMDFTPKDDVIAYSSQYRRNNQVPNVSLQKNMHARHYDRDIDDNIKLTLETTSRETQSQKRFNMDSIKNFKSEKYERVPSIY